MAFQRKGRCPVLLWSAILPLILSTIRTCDCKECGGNFTKPSGIITSPNFPNPYPSNVTCIYLITRPEGEVITLTFTNISLEGSSYFYCFDYVEVQDGGSANSPTLGFSPFCGRALPKTQHTTQNIMRITFVSHQATGLSGFRAIYTSTLLPYQPLLVASDGLYRLDPETQIDTPLPILSSYTFLAIAFDPLDERIYWSTSYSINSAFLNGSDKIKHYSFDFGMSSECSGLAMDYLSHLLFFADMHNNVIGLIHVPSSNLSEVLATDLDAPSDIAVDIISNVMFWSQAGDLPKIERANYDGSDRRTIVTSVERPTTITLDLHRGYLYWVDSSSRAVGRSDFEGNHSMVIYSLPDIPNVLYSLALKDDLLYVSQGSSYTLISHEFTFMCKVNTTTGTSAGNFSILEFAIKDILVRDPNPVDKSPNRCDIDNGGCRYICVPKSGNSRACLCPEHMSCSNTGSNIPGCGGNFTSVTDIIRSPRYPRNYPSNSDCIYYIKRPKGDRITISFRSFSLEQSKFCQADNFEVRDGDQSTSPLLGRVYCGDLDSLPDLKSTQNVVRIRFRSDSTIQNTGFLLSYTTDSMSMTTVFTTSSTSLTVRKVIVNGPLIFDTNGFQKLTLTCQPDDAANVVDYSWSVPCYQKEKRTCSFKPLPAEDDGKPVGCNVKYTNGQWEYGLFTVTLNYPPSLRPIISGYKDGDTLKEGDRLNLTCFVAGGKPIVTSVLFSCPGYADDPDDISSPEGKQSRIQISHVRASDNGLRCECTAKWKNTDWYTLTAAIVLTFKAAHDHDMLTSESKSSVLKWTLGGAAVIILVLIIVVIIIIKRRRDERRNDNSLMGEVSTVTYRDLEIVESEHESASRVSALD